MMKRTLVLASLSESDIAEIYLILKVCVKACECYEAVKAQYLQMLPVP
jgi:hypothetical protein